MRAIVFTYPLGSSVTPCNLSLKGRFSGSTSTWSLFQKKPSLVKTCIHFPQCTEVVVKPFDLVRRYELSTLVVMNYQELLMSRPIFTSIWCRSLVKRVKIHVFRIEGIIHTILGTVGRNVVKPEILVSP